MIRWVAAAIGCLTVLGAACTGDGSDVRTLRIEARDGACDPAEFEVDAGQRLRFVLENQDSVAYTMTDPEGRVDDLRAAPSEETEQFHQLPAGSATYMLQCGPDEAAGTEIRIVAGGSVALSPTMAPATAGGGEPTRSPDEPDTTIAVSLADYTVTLSQTTVPTGRVLFIATNVSATETHELNILQLQPDGSFQNEGGIPPMAPQQGGSVLGNLREGTYRIACQIQIGESGSTVDHYQQGMWFDLVVE
jgi:plastocyanin